MDYQQIYDMNSPVHQRPPSGAPRWRRSARERSQGLRSAHHRGVPDRAAGHLGAQPVPRLADPKAALRARPADPGRHAVHPGADAGDERRARHADDGGGGRHRDGAISACAAGHRRQLVPRRRHRRHRRLRAGDRSPFRHQSRCRRHLMRRERQGGAPGAVLRRARLPTRCPPSRAAAIPPRAASSPLPRPRCRPPAM